VGSVKEIISVQEKYVNALPSQSPAFEPFAVVAAGTRAAIFRSLPNASY
jgi:hypothetical protein